VAMILVLLPVVQESAKSPYNSVCVYVWVHLSFVNA
jgi:hypothetical protein